MEKIGMMNYLMDVAAALKPVTDKFTEVMKNIIAPVLIVVGAAAAIFVIYLGIMYAKAEDANKRKEVQGRLIGAAIGLVFIIVGVTLCYAVPWGSLASTMGWS